MATRGQGENRNERVKRGGKRLNDKIKSIIEAITLQFLEENGFELVDVEYVKEGRNYFLRVYVDKEGGIDIDDCSRVSEYISTVLDENDPITEAYFLEVSSPGAERPLKKPQDYVKAEGKQVLVTTHEPVDGLKEFEGKLVAVTDEQLTVQIGKKAYDIPREKVAHARLAIVF
ncbi:MAG: ribosome maturation factor RimP [Gorillibacterium sp.]|nr:ribosome maturation factor RimP [Gorillibacterium sp.]